MPNIFPIPACVSLVSSMMLWIQYDRKGEELMYHKYIVIPACVSLFLTENGGAHGK